VSSSESVIRWRQLSLRSLIALVAILGIGLGIQVNGARRQQSAIVAITKVDGYYYYGFQHDGESYSQSEYPPGPDWLWKHVDLSYVDNVVAVGLNCKPATDETLEQLTNLRNLKELDLTNTLITDHGLKHLAGLTNLKYLRLDGTSGLSQLRIGVGRLQWIVEDEGTREVLS
jgi:hypothetical protein